MPVLSRRAFLAASASLAAGAGRSAAAPLQEHARPAAPPAHARRPRPPFRVWFQPRLFQRDIDLYANMTVDASGWLDPRLAELAGKTALDWVYGLNHPYAEGAAYWRDACSPAARGRPQDDPRFVSAGIAIDEWVPPALPDNVQWLTEGLRAGKAANPEVFIAVWTTDPTPPLVALGRDGIADLILVEGYTHSVTPGLTTSWDGALRRCDTLADAGLLGKTIFCFGHITPQPDSRGGHITPAWLGERADELKRRYPGMPGVAFFQPEDPDSPELRDLVRACDRLSGELWPDPADA